MRFPVALFVVLVSVLSAPSDMRGCEHEALQQQGRYRDYTISIYRNTPRNADDFRCVEILKDGKIVYSQTAYALTIGYFNDNPTDNRNEKHSLPIGMDITGDGQPDLLISERTGGAHCCLLYHIFQIGNEFKHIQTIDLEHSERAYFQNLDRDAALELKIRDWTFAYWGASFADSPAPEVVLKYSGRKYTISTDLMRKKPLGREKLTALATRIKSSSRWKNSFQLVPPALPAKMLSLIYSGNMDQAWELLDLSWPGNVNGKKEFLDDFNAQLRKSPYWEEIRKFNS